MGCLQSNSKDKEVHVISESRSSTIALSTTNNSNNVVHAAVLNPISEQPRLQKSISLNIPEVPVESVIQPDNTFLFSVMISPHSDALLKRMWIRKRGTMVRNWNSRYFVLEKSALKYYTDKSIDPPYGKNLKGQLSLMGTVCSLRYISNSLLLVELCGTKGEKELCLEMNLSNETQVILLSLSYH